MVEKAHYQTLHRGVNLTMTEIRRRYWIPRLRQLTKRIIEKCHGFWRFHATAYVASIPGQLLSDRTNERRSFQVTELDFAGLIIYKGRKDSLKQACILLITCSLNRAVLIELVGSQKIEEFIRALKHFVARRGRPVWIYLDNAKTFKAATTWIKSLENQERFMITWQKTISPANSTSVEPHGREVSLSELLV